jgi:hypothetical protein
MRDGISLETLGIPTAVIVTTEFVNESITQRAALGMEDIEPVVIAHPLSSCTDDEIQVRAAQAANQIKTLLTVP